MKKLALLTAFLLPLALHAQNVSKYLDGIRDNTAALTAFFSNMPKGGDLHHHYSGSIYTETYIDRVVKNNYFINKKTYVVSKDSIPCDDWVRISELKSNLPAYKQQLMQKWSVKDYNGVSYPSDKLFFETFGGFGVTSNDSLAAGLLELKDRAIKENVSYIETMFITIGCNINIEDKYTARLKQAQAKMDSREAQKILAEIYQQLEKSNMKSCANEHNNKVATLHRNLKIDDDKFTMRYQNYIVRVVPPLSVFKSLVTAFESANTIPLIVGVNIVAPEDNETSMADYWLHMQMYAFCHSKYPDVKYAMHAGELTLGIVQPEQLTWHINEAVHTAGASRIGHGVDVAYEKDCYNLLKYMADKKVVIEINLYSNEFILKVKDDKHPVTLYNSFGVPIVIATDDAGVLRSNLIDQYVLLANRYKNIDYNTIKRFVYNSIDYSFIEEQAVKDKLKKDLDARFTAFERQIESLPR
jgi:adenosine deaminase